MNIVPNNNCMYQCMQCPALLTTCGLPQRFQMVSTYTCRHSELAFTPAVSALHGDAIMGLSAGEHTASAGWTAKYENIRQIRGLTTTLLPDYV